MTTPHPALIETALSFCRLCLGYSNPVDRRSRDWPMNATGTGPSDAWDPYIFERDGLKADFYYTDIRAVMESVRNWSAAQGISWCLECNADRSLARIGAAREAVGRNEVEHEDPCFALMAACVEAAKKLKF